MHEEAIAYMEKNWAKYEAMMNMVIDAIESIQNEVFVDASQSWPDWHADVIKEGDDFILICDTFEHYRSKLWDTWEDMYKLRTYLTTMHSYES